MDGKYNHKQVEQNKYENWLKKDYFKSGDLSKEPFCIVIPPPNVTGKLHLGHAWDTTIQDIIIRYKRMDGFDACWLPGMDHAGIATQAKVDEKLRNMGINPRELKREDWLKIAWEWKEEYALNIHDQWAKLGLSLDYEKERFTLDKGLSDAVNYVFVNLYNKGLIYRGERIINWDPKAKTALSNEEVIYKEVEGAFYHLKYMIENTDKYLEVATTRPETLFGDTAVAVNPNDERYKHLIGKNVILPVVNKLIPIIADEYCDIEFGTGIVKITPAHDPNDFEVGNRHNLERLNVMNTDGTMNENAGIYNGMDRFICRSKLVEQLTELNLLVKVEKMLHQVGHSERTDVIVEPYLSKQWFVKMRPLADKVLEKQKTTGKVDFVPERFEKILTHWMEISYDWCISRQLWWGHRIPVWYKDEEMYVGYEAPEGEGWIQDNDVLDTWFSSALWPFSTFGWPNDFNTRYFPNDVLVTGYDIIPFWVCRMIFQSLEFTDEIPFKECLIHGLIRDKDGRKMSKSLGNGIDPMDIIEEYGADSLRYFLVTNTAPGQDLRFDIDKVKSTWNFINKIWNASRYVIMNLEGFTKEDYSLENLDEKDKWILTKSNETIKDVRKYMEKYEFAAVGSLIYNFVWNDYCDWYIELSKTDMSNTNKSVLLKVLIDILKMLHPFTPYVTEEIYQLLPIKDESIMISNYPKYNKQEIYKEEKNQIDSLITLIKEIRSAKLDYNFKEFYIEKNSDILNNKEAIFKMLKLTEENIVTELNDLTVLKLSAFNTLIGYVKKEINIDLLLKEKETLENSIKRRENLLNNENYVKKAPENIVLEDKKKLEEEKEKLKNILESLN